MRSPLEKTTASGDALSLWRDHSRTRLDVTVGFSTTNAWLSRLIRWITRGKVSHAWLAYNDQTLGLRMVMQAEAWAFELRPWHRWTQENTWVAEFRILGGDQLLALQLRAKDIGLKYDYVAGLWVGIAAWFKRWLKTGLSFRPSRTPKKLMCSEAIVRFLKEAQHTCAEDLDEELTSPVELYDILRASPNCIPRRYSVKGNDG